MAQYAQQTEAGRLPVARFRTRVSPRVTHAEEQSPQRKLQKVSEAVEN